MSEPVPQAAEGKPPTAANNEVRQSVEDLCEVLREIHEVRENVLAFKIPLQTVNVLVGMGTSGRLDPADPVFQNALAASKAELGVGAMGADELTRQITTLSNLEKDAGEVRNLARTRGLNMAALNALVLFLRQHPGDGGGWVVRTFVSYAIACGISLQGVGNLADELMEKPASVLPDIPRREPPGRKTLNLRLIMDIGLSTLIGVGVIWMVA